MRVGSLVKITEYSTASGQNMGIITEKDWDMDNELLWKIQLFDGEVIYAGKEYVVLVSE